MKPIENLTADEIIANAKAVRARLWGAPPPRPVVIDPVRAVPPAPAPEPPEPPNPEPEMSVASSADAIAMQVARVFGIGVDDLKGRGRHAMLVLPRQFFMWRVRTELGFSLPMIARICGNRDHTTVLHGIRMMARIIGDAPTLAEAAARVLTYSAGASRRANNDPVSFWWSREQDGALTDAIAQNISPDGLSSIVSRFGTSRSKKSCQNRALKLGFRRTKGTWVKARTA